MFACIIGTVTHYNNQMRNTHCSSKQHMMVERADYGHFDNSGTFNERAEIDTGCSKLTNCQVKFHCDGRRSCDLMLNINLLSSTYCSDTSKQLYIKYTCRDNYSPSAITEGN
jgi:hypothetical protein